jgi:hypothetical protein
LIARFRLQCFKKRTPNPALQGTLRDKPRSAPELSRYEVKKGPGSVFRKVGAGETAKAEQQTTVFKV